MNASLTEITANNADAAVSMMDCRDWMMTRHDKRFISETDAAAQRLHEVHALRPGGALVELVAAAALVHRIPLHDLPQREKVEFRRVGHGTHNATNTRRNTHTKEA